jgi:hypothetical protein
MRGKRPKTVFLLIVVFAWSVFKDVELLARGSNGTEHILYDAVGVGWLALALLAIITLLDMAAVVFLVRPAHSGLIVCLFSIGLTAFFSSLAFAIARVHPDVARHAYVVSRESRGLSASSEVVDAAVNPTTTLLLLFGSLLISGLLATLVIVNRNYFRMAATRQSEAI